MTPDTQFWWNWWISAAVAFGTFAAVFVALFRDFRSKFFPPRLTLKLAVPEGEKAKVRLTWLEQGEPKERGEDARYYHIRVSNDRRQLSPAKAVQVFLIRMEEPGPDGELQVKWIGDIPMRWRNQEFFPLTRTIGPPYDSDLCCVVKGKWLELLPLIAPYNLDVKRTQKSLFVLSLQARANETDSAILRVQISWDGGWEDGDLEMKNHLKVKVISKQEA